MRLCSGRLRRRPGAVRGTRRGLPRTSRWRGLASAAVRLLALDPMRATAVLARLTRDIDHVAERAAAAAGGPLDELPCPSAPALDLLAEAHIRAEVRLFES